MHEKHYLRCDRLKLFRTHYTVVPGNDRSFILIKFLDALSGGTQLVYSSREVGSRDMTFPDKFSGECEFVHRPRDVNISAKFSEKTELVYRSRDINLSALNLAGKVSWRRGHVTSIDVQ